MIDFRVHIIITLQYNFYCLIFFLSTLLTRHLWHCNPRTGSKTYANSQSKWVCLINRLSDVVNQPSSCSLYSPLLILIMVQSVYIIIIVHLRHFQYSRRSVFTITVHPKFRCKLFSNRLS